MTEVRNKNILFLSWKDVRHPAAGGAEVLTDALAHSLAEHNTVTYFTSAFPGSQHSETYNGYTVIRKGNRYTTIIYAWLFWHMGHKKPYDIIIDQVHGVPFFSPAYYKHPKIITLVMEVAGELWANALPGPFIYIGTLCEHLWLRAYKTIPIVTISPSTKQELIERGISDSNISIIPMFSQVAGSATPKKAAQITLLFLGRIAPVKRIEDVVAAYKLVKKSLPNIKLIITGKTEAKYDAYKESIQKLIAGDSNISIQENISESEKALLLERAHLLLMTSKKEGYGLVIQEAAAYGTPTIGYNIPGICDAVIDGSTGILTDETPQALAKAIISALSDTATYNRIQQYLLKNAPHRNASNTTEKFKYIITSYL